MKTKCKVCPQFKRNYILLKMETLEVNYIRNDDTNTIVPFE